MFFDPTTTSRPTAPDEHRAMEILLPSTGETIRCGSDREEAHGSLLQTAALCASMVVLAALCAANIPAPPPRTLQPPTTPAAPPP